MKNFIEITDGDTEIISISLSDLLEKISDQKNYASWYMLYFYGTAQLNSNLDVLELENKAINTKSGLSLSWQKLKAIADNLDQVIDIIVVASDAEPSKYQHNIHWWQKFPLVIQMIDGYSWEVYSSDTAIIEYLASIFPYTKTSTLIEKFKA